jgi:hypothetical protein
MARTFFWLMLLLNALYWSWAEGWLLPYGFGPLTQREPQRLAQQIQPQAITLVSQAEARLDVVAGPSEEPLCLQTGPLEEAQAALVRAYLESSWPADSWVFETVPGLRLRLPVLPVALQARLPELTAVLPPGALESCPGSEAAP